MIVPGQVYWVRPDATIGREQSGRRPAVVVSGTGYLEAVTTLVWVVPVTSVDRRWDNHVELAGATGLAKASFAMTEQLRVISRERLDGLLGAVDDATLERIRSWIRDFLVD
ncbi:type II toxin-antitoxin system PemK/MazF family toxin [Tessaracoccus caeni]|uniref:type II toxin-antitoxin system PemK/MazF family toxin n=1 Tax=Tessaracoccus caeni TaxID=3031239 RepID=UPI0023DC3611|nr:type II toxin-antitoxin system PemK/MazF family toxin [Tessaracoccus caeni]MDF1488578.1 type II toxin-antitoxin system PemK/MazF family toxin [Tessaracoccus caeni]